MILKARFTEGSANGTAWIFQTESPKPKENRLTPEASVQKLDQIFDELKERFQNEKSRLGKAGEYLDFPMAILSDPALHSELHASIENNVRIEEAVERSLTAWEMKFKKLPDPYLKLRSHDLADLRRLILDILDGTDRTDFPREPFILVANDIFVMELLKFRKFPLIGICLEGGNETAHGVLLAKALGIPLAGQVRGILKNCKTGDTISFDDQTVYLNEPVPKGRVPIGTRPTGPVPVLPKGVAVRANVQMPEEFEEAKKAGAMGIGLFRTELLWLSRKLSPAEEMSIYREAIQAFSPYPVVFRLADFGSDKPYEGVKWPNEMNPALGWRGLRLLLDEKTILRRQLDCMFAAAGKTTLHLLLPMVRTLDEIQEFVAVLKSYKKKYPCNVSVGIMVETPSSAYLIPQLPRDIRFVSLGTNDLLQYFFAIDRIHPQMKADPMNPLFLEFLKTIIASVKRKRISISICGELASDPKRLPVLFKLGLRDFSVSIPNIDTALSVISKISKKR